MDQTPVASWRTKHGANRDEHNRQHKRSSTLGSTVSHGTPLPSLLRSGNEKSSAFATGVWQREYPEMPAAATPHAGTLCYSREELGQVQGAPRMAAWDRVIWVVLDSVGIGELPDAADYGDVGRNTLGHIAESRPLHIPNLVRLDSQTSRR